MINAIGIIPARYFSTRFEGKVLANIAGKPLIQHVWERAKKARVLDDLLIACDHELVARSVEEFGAKAVMTSKQHSSGTDRISEVVNPLDVKVVVNIQGDEPLVHPTMIDDAARALLEDDALYMSTIMKRINDANLFNDPNVVKVVVDRNNFALYFSRSSIPNRHRCPLNQPAVFYKHIGLYAYTKDFLFIYKNLPVSELEKAEQLEQLRVLEAGFRIKVIETRYDTQGVDTPQDLERVKEMLCAE